MRAGQIFAGLSCEGRVASPCSKCCQGPEDGSARERALNPKCKINDMLKTEASSLESGILLMGWAKMARVFNVA